MEVPSTDAVTKDDRGCQVAESVNYIRCRQDAEHVQQVSNGGPGGEMT
jgi:hypothetical protein